MGWPVPLRASRPEKHAEILGPGISFSMPMQAICERGRLAPISALPSLVQTTKPPVSAMAKLTPVSPACAPRNLLAKVAAGGFGEVFGIGRAFVRAELLVEQLADFFPLQMDRRHDDVTGRFLAELHDAFAKIGVGDFDATRLKVRIQMALFGQHRLRFDEPRYAMLRENLMDNGVVLGGIASPVDLDSIRHGIALKLLQVIGKPREGVSLDRSRRAREASPIPGCWRPAGRAWDERTRATGHANAPALHWRQRERLFRRVRS